MMPTAPACEAAEVALKVRVQRGCGEVEHRRVRLLDPQLTDVAGLGQRWVRGACVLQYTDDEGDLVTVETDDEWQECLVLWRRQGGEVLRLLATRRRASGAGDALCGTGRRLRTLSAEAPGAAAPQTEAEGAAAGDAGADGGWDWLAGDVQQVPEGLQKQVTKAMAKAEKARRKAAERAEREAERAERKAAERAAREAERAERKAAERAAKAEAKERKAAERARVEPQECEGCGCDFVGKRGKGFCCKGCKHGGAHTAKCRRVDSVPPAAASDAHADGADVEPLETPARDAASADASMGVPSAPAAEPQGLPADQQADDPADEPAAARDAEGSARAKQCAAQLRAMGFEVTPAVDALIQQHNADVAAVVAEML